MGNDLKLIAATQNVIDYLIFGVLTAVVNYLGSAGNGDPFYGNGSDVLV